MGFQARANRHNALPSLDARAWKPMLRGRNAQLAGTVDFLAESTLSFGFESDDFSCASRSACWRAIRW